MKYIDKTYFKNQTSIPNQNESFVGLDDIIKSGTKEILIKTVGHAIWDLLQTSTNYDDTDSSLYKLLCGETYTDNDGVVCRWEGLVNSDKHSFISDYCWLKWSEENWLLNFGGGSGTIEPSEATVKNQNIRRAKVEADMEKGIKSLYDWIYYTEPFNDFEFVYDFKNPVSWLF